MCQIQFPIPPTLERQILCDHYDNEACFVHFDDEGLGEELEGEPSFLGGSIDVFFFSVYNGLRVDSLQSPKKGSAMCLKHSKLGLNVAIPHLSSNRYSTATMFAGHLL